MITNTEVSQTYTQNGSQTTFPITFDLHSNDQVKVKKADSDGVETVLTEDVDYTITGGDPGNNIEMTEALSADYLLTVYRDTPRKQTASYVETGAFPAETHETALDKIVMMIQELAAGVAATFPASAALNRTGSQEVAAAGTITYTSGVQRQLITVQGASSAATTASTTTAITDGEIDGQELMLVGLDDTATLTITSAGNVRLKGTIELRQYSVLVLFWSETDGLWIEISRSE